MSIVSSDHSRIIQQYDTNGYLKEYWYFNPVEVLHLRIVGLYNEKGQLIDQTKLDRGIDPVLNYKYAYDAAGKPIGRSAFSKGHQIEKFIYAYDANGRLTDSIRQDGFGINLEHYTTKYDKEGRIISRVDRIKEAGDTIFTNYTYDSKGNIKSIERTDLKVSTPDLTLSFTYDDRFRLLSEKAMRSKSKIEYEKQYSYDSAGNLTGFILLDSTGRREKKSYKYDNMGRSIEDIYYDDKDGMTLRYTYQYNAEGEKIEHVQYRKGDKKELALKWIYEYDAQKNWIRRTEYINDAMTVQTTREFEYY